MALTCDWWFNVKCAATSQLYVLNERLYKYILPQKLSFPEDFQGPLVDQYLALKFKEIEEKVNINLDFFNLHFRDSVEDLVILFLTHSLFYYISFLYFCNST